MNNMKQIIIEKYNIGGITYSIQYTDETKAIDLFNCLNRMLVQRDGFVNYKDISIQSMPSIICVEDIKKKPFRSLFD